MVSLHKIYQRFEPVFRGKNLSMAACATAHRQVVKIERPKLKCCMQNSMDQGITILFHGHHLEI